MLFTTNTPENKIANCDTDHVNKEALSNHKVAGLAGLDPRELALLFAAQRILEAKREVERLRKTTVIR